jgi:putative SOS response-associated peptidase YedK
MCGRYVSVSTPEQLAAYFGVDEVKTEALGERYNVAPTLDVYSIIEREGQRRLGTLRWGFVPHWAKSVKKGPSPINVRVETIHEKGMFASAFEKRRCLLPADGFYEWQEREASTRKQPWFIHHPDDEPLAFAGIWTVWRPPGEDDADPVYSTAIVTTAAAGRMEELHDRMPVILPKRLWDAWLTADPQDAEHLQEVVAAIGVPDLEAYRITDRVNNVRNDGSELLEHGEVD